jgi:hypothetical protein
MRKRNSMLSSTLTITPKGPPSHPYHHRAKQPNLKHRPPPRPHNRAGTEGGNGLFDDEEGKLKNCQLNSKKSLYQSLPAWVVEAGAEDGETPDRR